MNMPTVSPYLDNYVNTAGLRAVKIRVAWSKDTLDLPTNYHLTTDTYKAVFNKDNMPRLRGHREIRADILKRVDSVIDVIRNNPALNKEQLTKTFGAGRGVVVITSLQFLLQEKIDEMTTESIEKKITNGVNVYRSVQGNCLDFFGEDFEIHRLTPTKLQEFETWLMEPGRKCRNHKSDKVSKRKRSFSWNTVCNYMKCLRHIVYRAIGKGLIKSELMPFGKDRLRYQIPSERIENENYLEEQDQKILFGYNSRLPELRRALEVAQAKGTTRAIRTASDALRMAENNQWAFDMWHSLYFSFGINPMDLCQLRVKNIVGDEIHIYRNKTYRARRDKRKIKIPLDPFVKEVISKHGNKSLNPDAYVFPILNDSMNGLEIRAAVGLFMRRVNRAMERVAKECGLERVPKCQTARHTFSATQLQGGATTEQLQDFLGHGAKSTTEHYKHGFSKNIKIAAQNLLRERLAM